jgi:hypothetical protein
MIIETGNHCFGPICRINGQDLMDNEYSTDPVATKEARELVLKLLKDNIESIESMEWKELLDMIVHHVKGFECLADDHNTCDQCGNRNEYYKFEKKDEV